MMKSYIWIGGGMVCMSEEDIKILKELIEFLDRNDVQDDYCSFDEEIQAIENILARLEQLEKENEELKYKHTKDGRVLFTIEAINENYIPKSKIIDRIVELETEINNSHPASDCMLIEDCEVKIEILKELLEVEK